MNEGLRKWKAAVAAHHKAQRQQRGKRVMKDASRIGPGMVRRLPPGQDTGTARQ